MMYIALLLNHSGKNLGASNLRYVAKKNATQTQKISLKMRNPFVCIFINETIFSIMLSKTILLSFSSLCVDLDTLTNTFYHTVYAFAIQSIKNFCIIM